MKEFYTGASGTASVTVCKSNTASAVKSGSLEVFSTPMLLALMEEATCNACESFLEGEETTVGTCVSVKHVKASGIGTRVTAFAELEKADGRKLIFAVKAEDGKGDIIGSGTVERFVVSADKFMKKVNSL